MMVKPDVSKPEPDKEKAHYQVSEETASQPGKPIINQEEIKKYNLPQDINIILERLVQGISTISMELSAIRSILEKNYLNDRQEVKSGKSVIYR
jgi:hypothetical protein